MARVQIPQILEGKMESVIEEDWHEWHVALAKSCLRIRRQNTSFLLRRIHVCKTVFTASVLTKIAGFQPILTRGGKGRVIIFQPPWDESGQPDAMIEDSISEVCQAGQHCANCLQVDRMGEQSKITS